MVVGAVSSRTELAIVGAGPGGYVAALRAADAGIDVTVIDRAELGGTCLNVGCIPSKSLIELANLRHNAMNASQHGLLAQVVVDAPAISEHLSVVSRQLRSGVSSLLQDAGVNVIKGDANFARYDRLSIADDEHVQHLEFDNAIIATGSRPIMLDAFPLGDGIVSSTGALSLSSVPSNMVVIGAGYIGVELGTAWAKLGANVTIVEQGPDILPSVSPALRQPVQRRLEQLGVDVLTGTTATNPLPQGLELSDGTRLDADVVVVAVGRRPNSDQASIGTLGLTMNEHGQIVVDAQMRAKSGIYAIGDLVPGPALAHKASAEAEVAVQAILGANSVFAPAAIPEVIFSDPEILSVGEPIDAGPTHRFPHMASARARTLGETSGATYVVADSAGTVIGVHAVGPHVSELAGEATLAIEMAATVEDLAHTIHAHPTMSESVAEAAWLALSQPLHVRR